MFIQFISGIIENLKEREFLIDLFMYLPDRKIYDKSKEYPDNTILFKPGKTSLTDAEYIYLRGDDIIELPVTNSKTRAPFNLNTEVQLKKGVIGNYTDDKEITTTIGRILVNYLLLSLPSDNKIPYDNEVMMNSKRIEAAYAALILAGAPVEMYRKYMDYGYFLTHFGELVVPSLSERALTSDPNIPKRKAELLEEFKDQLDDPKIVAAIENELVEMDKAWIKGDISEGLFAPTAGKSYGVHRKKMFSMVGGVDDFSKEGGVVTIPHSLNDGWDKKSFAALANEIRTGAYARGKETAKGGEMTKFIFRAFQDVKIIEDDCGTTRGLTVTFNEHLKPSAFTSHSVISGNKLIEITNDNVDTFAGKTVKLRSPLYCSTENGFCYRCSGLNFKRLGIVSPGVSAIEVSSKFLGAAMSAMHGTVISTKKINPMDFFKGSNDKK